MKCVVTGVYFPTRVLTKQVALATVNLGKTSDFAQPQTQQSGDKDFPGP